MKQFILFLFAGTALAQLPNPTIPNSNGADFRGKVNANFIYLDAYKAPLASPAFTGTPTIGNISLNSLAGITAPNVAQMDRSSLLAEYRFTDGSGTVLTDSSGNGNHGTLVNAPTWSPQGLAFAASSQQKVNLPAGLTASVVTIQYIADVSSVFLTAGVQPVIGNTSTGFEIHGVDTRFVLPNQPRNSRVAVWVSGVSHATSSATTGTPSVVTVVLGSSTDTIYIDGEVSSRYVINTGSLSFRAGQMRLGQDSSGFNYLNGTLYYMAFYSTALTAQQVRSNGAVMMAAVKARGVQWPAVNSSVTNVALFHGDSLTEGQNATNPYSTAVSPTDPFNKTTMGTPAAALIDLEVAGPGEVDSQYRPHAARNVVVLLGGTNDALSVAGGSYSEAFLERSYVAYVRARKRVGWQVVVVTLPSRSGTGADAQRVTFNSFITSTAAALGVTVADAGADSHIGTLGTYSNLTYFASDGVHLTDTGYGIISTLVTSAINSIP